MNTALECMYLGTSPPLPVICTQSVSYLRAPWLVGRAALQVCQDTGEGVDLSIQTGASLLQRLLWSFHLKADITKRCAKQWVKSQKTAHNDSYLGHFVRPHSKVKDGWSLLTSNSDYVLLCDILVCFFFFTLLKLWIAVSEFMFHLDLRQSFGKPHINSRDFTLREK